MVPDGSGWVEVIPDLAWPSGSDLEWPWTDPDVDLGRIGSVLDRFWNGLDWIGLGLTRLGSDLNRILARIWAILDAN